jgi:molybdate transport system substrate-binding protein
MTLRGISSMATRQILAQLCAAYAQQGGEQVEVESMGGVDAAKRVAAGEDVDLVLLASDAIDKLMAAGHLKAGSRVDWVRSSIAVAIQSGAPRPDISSAKALREALLAAPSLSYSTGPSGVYLAQLFESMGIGEVLKAKTVVPPPGVPVGSLVAKGEAALGFQQLAELINLDGIQLLGNLPDEVAYTTTFSAAISAKASEASEQAAKRFLQFIISPQAIAIKQSQGMTPV